VPQIPQYFVTAGFVVYFTTPGFADNVVPQIQRYFMTAGFADNVVPQIMVVAFSALILALSLRL
jgi:hypothetical protein